jgi:hypothetical protein
MLLAAVLILNPVGLDFLHSAFFTDDLWSRNIAQPIVLTGLAILILIGPLEWLIRVFISKRRGRGATTA